MARKNITEPTDTPAIDPQEAAGAALSDDLATDVPETDSEPSAPQSAPDAPLNAGATPATDLPIEAVKGVQPATLPPKPKATVADAARRAAFSTVPDAPFRLPEAEDMFPGYPEDAVAELKRVVPVQVIKDFKGCITLRYEFSCRRGQQFRVAKWFALQHQDKLVIKE